MPNLVTTEATLRSAVIDRLIAASLQASTQRDTSREATLARWRKLAHAQLHVQPGVQSSPALAAET